MLVMANRVPIPTYREHPQNTADLVALRCVPLSGTARHERQQRGTVTIGNPVHRAFEPTATSTEVNTCGYLL